MNTYRSFSGFTLVELLVVMVVLAVLASLLLAGIGVVRRSAYRTQAFHAVQGLVRSLEAYQHSDPRHRYPLEDGLLATPAGTLDVVQPLGIQPVGTIPPGVLGVLRDLVGAEPPNTGMQDGVAVDPWHQPYHYFLRWPTAGEPGAPAGMPTQAQHATWARGRSATAPPYWNWLPTEDVNGDGVLNVSEDIDGNTVITAGLPARWRRNPAGQRIPAAFPYVMSLGQDGRWDACTTWIYQSDHGSPP